jgi:hypothetical protein
VRSIRGLIVCAVVLAVTGCGSDSETTSPTASSMPSTTTVEAPSGPIVRICDRSLAREVRLALRSEGYNGKLPPPRAAGTQRLSSCDFRKVAHISLDAAPDAVQRYQNRIVETTQFSRSIPSHVPRPIRGVGDPDLGPAGANWIPFQHQLLSARGKRVLIVSVDAGGLDDAQRFSAAKAISFEVYDRLGSG